MFVQTQEIDAQDLRDEVAEVKTSERPPPVLRVIHNIDREREAQAIILRLVLSERPSELRIEAVMARIGEPDLAARAVAALVESGLILRIDEYVLATAAAVGFHHLRPYMSRQRPELRSA